MQKHFRNSRLLLAVCILTLIAAVVPAAISINLLFVLRGHVADIQRNAAGANQALNVLEMASNVLPTFAAIALELSDTERASVLKKTDIQFVRLEQAVDDLDRNASELFSEAAKMKLSDAMEHILHSWEEVRSDLGHEMSEFEKSFHILKIIKQLQLAREILDPIRADSDSAAKKAAQFSFERIEQANVLLFSVLIAFGIVSILAITGIFHYIWSMRRSNKKLETALIKAKSADRTKSEFLANMSHEIRTPMNGVIGMSELLATTPLNDRQDMFVGIIRTSAESLLNIINDILDFSKINAGQMTLDPKSLKLARIANEPAQLVAHLAEKKGLELLVRVQPNLPQTVVGDFGRLRQVVTNLLGNAVKFTERGQVVIDVSGDERVDDGARVLSLRFEVRDTGVGIPLDHQRKIFDQFSQADGSSTRRHQGTGLGLSISKGLVEMMGGEIGVHSVLGEGSTFWFTIELPIANTVERAVRVPADLAGKRALVIDDNETNRFILQELLVAWQMDEVSAASGKEGLQRLMNDAARGRPFDIVILDHQMPEIDGADVLRAIRGAAGIEETPIIMLTSLDEPGSAGQCHDLGVQGYLVKPAPASQLLNAIIEILSDRAAVAAPESRRGPADTGTAHSVAADGRADILVVEDNEVNRILAEQTLLDAGLSYVVAENGALAVEAFERSAPKAILMDVSMPEMDGYLATRKIREIETEWKLPRTPIIGLTAHALEGDRANCLEAGMDDYLAKPISPAKLTAMIESWIAPESEAKTSAATSAVPQEGGGRLGR